MTEQQNCLTFLTGADRVYTHPLRAVAQRRGGAAAIGHQTLFHIATGAIVAVQLPVSAVAGAGVAANRVGAICHRISRVVSRHGAAAIRWVCTQGALVDVCGTTKGQKQQAEACNPVNSRFKSTSFVQHHPGTCCRGQVLQNPGQSHTPRSGPSHTLAAAT